MRKNVLKAGLLALVIALAMAACADPNASDSGGDSNSNSATVIRLYLDRVIDNLDDGDQITLTIGEEILVPENYHWTGRPGNVIAPAYDVPYRFTATSPFQYHVDAATTDMPKLTYPYARAYVNPSNNITRAAGIIRDSAPDPVYTSTDATNFVPPFTSSSLDPWYILRTYDRGDPIEASFGKPGYHPKPDANLDAVANTGRKYNASTTSRPSLPVGTGTTPEWTGGWGFSYGDHTQDGEDPWTPWSFVNVTTNATRQGSAVYIDKGKHSNFRGSEALVGYYSPTSTTIDGVTVIGTGVGRPDRVQRGNVDADGSGEEYISETTFRDDMRKTLMIRPGQESNYFISKMRLVGTGTTTDLRPATSVIDRSNTKKRVLWSGLVTLRKYGQGTSLPSATISGNVPQGLVEVTSTGQYFVDIFLYDATQNFENPLTLFTGSLNGYIELDVAFTANPKFIQTTGGTGDNWVNAPHPWTPVGDITLTSGVETFTGTTYAPPPIPNYLSGFSQAAIEELIALNGSVDGRPKGNMQRGMYYYTPKDKGFNNVWKYDDKDRAHYYETENNNIQRVNLKPGINELRLSMFSNTQFYDQK